MLSAREKRLKKRLDDAFKIITNSDDSLKYLQRSKDDVEREANAMQEEMQKLRETVSVLTAAANHTMKKEDFENLA